MAASAQVTVTTSATLLTAADATDTTSGNSLAFKNTGAVTVYLGGAGVTTSTGYPLAAGDQIGGDASPGEDFYGVVASGTCVVAVLRSR